MVCNTSLLQCYGLLKVKLEVALKHEDVYFNHDETEEDLVLLK